MNDTLRLLEAVRYAAIQHRRQRRKGGEAHPYINHPVAVAHLLASVAGVTDIALLQAAVLHDTVEDTGSTEEDLRARFGDDVARLVMEVTDDKSLPKAMRKQLQIDHAHHKSERARLLKIADKIQNLTDIRDEPPADWSLERKREYFDWAAAVVAGLRGVNAALDALFDEVYARKP